jgi:hypothetical protein
MISWRRLKLYQRTLEKPLKLTPDEAEWWGRTGRAMRRRAVASSASYIALGFSFGFVITAMMRLGSGAPFPWFLLVALVLSGVPTALMIGFFNSRAKRDQSVRSKRLREAMAADADNPAPETRP